MSVYVPGSFENTCEKARRTAEMLRAHAEARAKFLQRSPSGVPEMRDAHADALADLAELVLQIIVGDEG